MKPVTIAILATLGLASCGPVGSPSHMAGASLALSHDSAAANQNPWAAANARAARDSAFSVCPCVSGAGGGGG